MKKKVLIISSFPAPYRVGVFKELAKEYDVDVFFASGSNENRNADWFYKNTDFSYSLITSEKGKAQFCKALRNIKGYDCVIPYDPATYPAVKAILLCRLMRIPYFLNCDGAFLTRNRIKDRIKRFLFSGATGCFSSGKSATEYFEYYGVPKKRIIEHKFTSLEGSDILCIPKNQGEKRRLREELEIADRITVLAIGQFIYRKGFDVLLEAWKMVGKDAQLIIIGGGEQENLYHKIIDDLKLKNVYIIGFKGKDELRKYYDASDIFVLPTREDIWGLVINEAMGRGLPVITTDKCVAGLEMIKEGTNGYIVPSENPIKLAGTITALIESQELRDKMAMNNIELSKGMTISMIGEGHIRTIDELLK